MKNTDDKRKQKRVSTHCRVFLENGLGGYLIDITRQGVKIWLDKHKDFKSESLCIGIRFLKNEDQQTLHFNLHTIWCNTHKSQYFNEIGCQFQDLSTEQETQLNELIRHFESLS